VPTASDVVAPRALRPGGRAEHEPGRARSTKHSFNQTKVCSNGPAIVSTTLPLPDGMSSIFRRVLLRSTMARSGVQGYRRGSQLIGLPYAPPERFRRGVFLSEFATHHVDQPISNLKVPASTAWKRVSRRRCAPRSLFTRRLAAVRWGRYVSGSSKASPVMQGVGSMSVIWANPENICS